MQVGTAREALLLSEAEELREQLAAAASLADEHSHDAEAELGALRQVGRYYPSHLLTFYNYLGNFTKLLSMTRVLHRRAAMCGQLHSRWAGRAAAGGVTLVILLNITHLLSNQGAVRDS